MRNTNRIRPFCNELATIWETSFPDWRFGQLMMNFLGEVSTKIDPFFPEEDEMLEYLRRYAKTGSVVDETEKE